MRWQELTAPDFAQAVKDTGGVCLLAAGCLEKHGEHLPLGTDFLNGFELCTRAAEKEPAIVFPPYYFGQINEARCFPGTVAIEPVLTLQLLLAVCDEIARNGLHKIIIHNAHGGNEGLLNYLVATVLAQRKPYCLYIPAYLAPPWRLEAWNKIMETRDKHAGESETSISLANHGHLVKQAVLQGRKAEPLNRLAHLPPGQVSNSWYASFPEHYAGDGNAGTKEKGEKLRELLVDTLAEYIKAVKADTVVAALAKEFYGRCDQIGR